MKLFKGNTVRDDRGKVSFVNDFDFRDVKRFYVVENHEKGFVRAWHGHKQESKYVFVSKGWIILVILPMDSKKSKKYRLFADDPQILYIPPGNYNGFKTMTADTQVFFFSTSTLEQSKADDLRLDYDPTDKLFAIEQR